MMGKSIEAVYERGVFKPLDPVELKDGQRVSLSVEPLALAPDEAGAQLSKWAEVYAGLTDNEIDEIEQIAFDRSHFVREREEAP